MPAKLTEIELFIIAKVKEIRLAKGLSQEKLSLALDKGVGFIGDREAPSKSAKYNIKNLNEIAKILKCSPKDFWPHKPL
ncbi:MAG: helix-turn-helix transcriptional regulator [Sediminicola sp.]